MASKEAFPERVPGAEWRGISLLETELRLSRWPVERRHACASRQVHRGKDAQSRGVQCRTATFTALISASDETPDGSPSPSILPPQDALLSRHHRQPDRDR